MDRLPRLNSYVYIITYSDGIPFCITKDRVYMKNKDEFITEEMIASDVIEEYRLPCDIKSYGDTWTKTLKEAKEVIKKWFNECNWLDYDIEKCSDGWNILVFGK